MTSVRLLHLFVGLLVAGLLAAYGLFIWHDHETARDQARDTLVEITRLMEEHARAALLASELQLSRVVDMIGDRPLASLAGSEQDWRALKRFSAELPHADSFWLFDRNADLVLSTLKPSGVRLNVRDRAYFDAIANGAESFVSPMIWGKVYGGYYFAVSRRLGGPGEAFKGVVQFSIKASYFSDFYQSLRPSDGASFTIVKEDGSLVARHPLPASGEEHIRLTTLMENLPRAPFGSYTAKSNFDDVERLYVYRRVNGYPLVVAAGLPTVLVFEEWRERARNSLALVAAVVAALGAMTWQLTQAMRREQAGRARAEALLADKQVLFQEIHHRVKNNLQIIASFLTMQGLKSADPATADAFDEALSRVHSMGLVHQILYEQNEASDVSMDCYLHALSANVGASFGTAEREIEVEVAAHGLRLPLEKAVPLALVANEALTNAVKHAYPPGRRGTIRIGLERTDGGLSFTLSDDGIGMPADEQPTRGLGFPILSALAGQLGGTLSVQRDGGTCIRVAFPN